METIIILNYELNAASIEAMAFMYNGIPSFIIDEEIYIKIHITTTIKHYPCNEFHTILNEA